MTTYDFEQSWKKVESLEEQGLYKTLFNKVNEIHKEALQAGEPEHIIKSLIYQGKYYNRVEEDGMIKTILAFEEGIDHVQLPEKAILQSLLAQLYDSYLTQNLYKLSNRLNAPDSKEEDIRNWAPAQFVDRSTKLFLESVSHEGLDRVKVQKYRELFRSDIETVDLRNTLLDILGHRAIAYFNEGKAFLVQPHDRYILKDEKLFAEAKTYANIDFSKEGESMEKRVLILYQDLLKKHLKAKNKAEILDLELNRLNFVYRKFNAGGKDDLYEQALYSLDQEFEDEEGLGEVNFYLANLYYSQYQKNHREKKDYSDHISKAHAICVRTIKEHPDSYGADLCKALKSKIENKELNIRTEQVNLPGEHLIYQIEYRNIQKLYFRILKLDKPAFEELSQIRQEEALDFISGLQLIKAWDQQLPRGNDFKSHRVELAMDPLPTGSYALLASDVESFNPQKGKLQVASFFVSTLAYWHSNVGNDQFIYVVNRKTGHPENNVKVNLYEWDYRGRDRQKRFVFSDYTSEEGFIKFSSIEKKRYNYLVELETDSEDLYFDNLLYAGSFNQQNKVNQKLLYFLDRSIYRPGQNVYFKGLLIEENNQALPRIIPDQEEISVNLYDVNHQLIETIKVNTNEFGSLNGSFTLPESGLTGRMSIGSDRSRDRVYFNVEEYKRPKFKVAFKNYTNDYKLGDRIELEGEAISYSGMKISNAEVVYRVKRRSYFPYWRPYFRVLPFNQSTIEIANGSTSTDESGIFRIEVELLADDVVPEEYNPYFEYYVEAEVIDLTGETRSAGKYLHASWLSKNVQIKLQETTHADSMLVVEFDVRNWSGEKTGLEGTFKLQRLKEPDRTFRKRFWTKADEWVYNEEQFSKLLPYYSYKDEDLISSWESIALISEEKIDTEEKNKFEFKLQSGSYKLSFHYVEPSGKKVNLEKYHRVFDDRKLPSLEEFVFETSGNEPGEMAKIEMRSSQPGSMVLFELFEKNKRTVSDWKNPGTKTILEIPVKERHRGNFFTRATYVYNNRFYSQKKTIVVPWSNKELDIEYVNFRSKLKPGTDEKWILKVNGPKKDVVMAEMLASMYDASLDAIKMHRWDASIYRMNHLNSQVRYFGFGQSRIRNFVNRSWNEWYNPRMQKNYKTINWFGMEHIPGFSYYKEHLGIVQGAPPTTAERMMSKRVPTGAVEDAEARSSEESGVVFDESIDGVKVDNEGLGAQADDTFPDKAEIRTNLDETVFFYPELRTDEEGAVLIEFVMNEALTTWKFQALAHTKELQFGLTENEVMTQKELMVEPNAPRFVRQGDKILLSSAVSNLTKEKMDVSIQLKILDPSGSNDISPTFIKDAKKSLILNADEKAAVRWELQIPENLDEELVIYQVWASAGAFTDGEENYLPILSKRRLITESMPFWIGGEENKEFRISMLDKINDEGLKAHSLTLESTANPIWYAIQAMPYLQDYNKSNSISLANALYSNLLAAKIVNDNPSIERVFQQWKNMESKGSNSLHSQLEKNPELKNILLRETPWVLDAQDESRQRRNIALLFQLNKIKQDKKQIMQLLRNLQQRDGGFSWFKGGRSSEFMTLYVLELLGKLKENGIDLSEESQLRQLQIRAVRYLDTEFSRRYKELQDSYAGKKADPDSDHLTRTDIYYLYVRSMFKEIDYHDMSKEASVFFLNQLERFWLNKGIYLEGMIALSLHNMGNSDAAKNILRSLEERSIYNEELGRYWKHHHGYHWFEFPIETQAMMIEAFEKIEENDQLVDELKIWLLKNKQTKHWKTAKASVAAINALIKNRVSLIKDPTEMRIIIGGDDITAFDSDEQTYEAGTGYLKRSWTAGEIEEEMQDLKVDNGNENIAWGAVYFQYFQDLDKIKSFKDTPLKLNRTLYKVVDSKKGETLVEVGNNQLTPGDKLLVRLRIEVDRPMDYIHLSDQKSAAVEGLEQLSQYHWNGGLFYYLSPKDSGTDIFIEHLPRGVYTIDYKVRVIHSGEFNSGIASIQSMYAPEYSGHTEGSILRVSSF